MKYLHEIRVSEEASARLIGADEITAFHLFWNNQRPGDDAPSDEMALLLQSAARTSREKDHKVWLAGAPGPLVKAQEQKNWERLLPKMMQEYEFEYGWLHEPYRTGEMRQKRRAEILHPVFVTKARSRPCRIAHVTDLHVDVRWDVFEQNLAPVAPASLQFNNCNRSSGQIYAAARKDADIVLMTGDLIDYGRGHVGVTASTKLGENRYYHRDRNWFLFYDFLASGKRYTRPVYTSLGNHDWRLNPYPPFAPGAPDLREIVHNFAAYSEKQLKEWVSRAHGANHDAAYSYDPHWKHVDLRDVFKVLGKAISSSETLEDKGLPTETHIDSIAWYLLAINPFVDYTVVLPGGYRLLMLDFAQREALLADDTRLGKNYGWVSPKDGRSRGPRAVWCLTKTQQWMVNQFTQLPGQAKVIGMHVPPLGPYPDWSEEDLSRGFKTYRKPLEARGPLTYRFETTGGGKALKGHPLFAIRPPGDVYGMHAEYGSFRSARNEFIKALAKPTAGVQLVFSGHIHRNDLLTAYVSSDSGDANLKGQYLMKSIAAAPRVHAGSARSPQEYAGATIDPRRARHGRAPLYVNSTSAGPLGNYCPSEGDNQLTHPGYTYVELAATGVVQRLAFRFPVTPQAIGQSVLPKAAGAGR
jgi:predicted MPP superfamily phosphohydrolase